MPKRSLAEQLDQAVQAMLERRDFQLLSPDPSLAGLLRIASELRELPREEFKAHLKSDLERTLSMATARQPIAAVRTFASPRLSYKSAAKAIEFYEKAFGAKESWRFETESGIGHAEIMIGDTVVKLSEEWPEGGRYSAETLGQSPVSMTINVPDVDAFVEHAVAAGAKLTRPITDQFYGHRDGTLLDPFGYAWNVYTVKEEMSVEEMHRRFREVMPPRKKSAVPPVPKGYRTLTPYIVAQDAAALIDFVKKTFDAEETFRTIGLAGGIHTEVRIGDSMLMIGGGGPGLAWRGTPIPQAFHVYVRNCDETYQRALEHGATSIDEPVDQDYGERSASLRDAAGNYW